MKLSFPLTSLLICMSWFATSSTSPAQEGTNPQLPFALQAARKTAERPPNFVVIFTDDQGYADVSCFGSTDIRTPRLDEMAAEGMKFTSFYAQPICGPSRAALMTGCYPMRVAERGNTKQVHPILHSDEITVAEVLKTKGYATACFGKWDLAKHSQDEFFMDLFPTRQGFDYFFGTPTSNDRVANLYRNEELIEPKTDMANADKAFYYYLRVHLQAVRQGKWKLHLPRDKEPIGAAPFSKNTHIASADRIGFDDRFLVDLDSDIGETTNVARQNPDVVKRLMTLAERMREDLGDFDRVGTNMRFFDLTDGRPSRPPVPGPTNTKKRKPVPRGKQQ